MTGQLPSVPLRDWYRVRAVVGPADRFHLGAGSQPAIASATFLVPAKVDLDADADAAFASAVGARRRGR